MSAMPAIPVGRYRPVDMSKVAMADALDPLSFDAILTARRADYVAALDEGGIDYSVETLETDPGMYGQRPGAKREMLARGRINDTVKAVLLASSWGSNLDALGAGRQTPRLVVKPADPEADTPAVMESDARYRRRIQLAPETWAGTGPLAAYAYFALDTLPMAQDVAVYDHRHGVGLKRGHILVVVLPYPPDAPEGVDDPEQVRQAVRDRLSAEAVAPGGLVVSVELARQVPINGAATLVIGTGPDRTVVEARANTSLDALFAERRGFHPLFSHSRLTKALQVDDVITLRDVSPAADIALDHRSVAVRGEFLVRAVP